MFPFAAIDDGRGRYAEPLSINAELGTREKVRAAAKAEGVTIAEFVRRAIGERIQSTTQRSTSAPVPQS